MSAAETGEKTLPMTDTHYIFIAFFGYVVWAEDTADAIILRDGGQSYACQTSRITPAPHDCKPVKEERS